jgi:AAA+ ATPase superfamily predicted ATPase
MDAFRPQPFYNRADELRALDHAYRHSTPGGQLALLYGRRRIGKTFLLQRFFTAGVTGTESPKPHAYYLADQTTAPEQRVGLAAQVLSALPDPGVTVEDLAVSYAAILRFVSGKCRQGERFGLVLDEFPYMVAQTPDLPSVIQSWWDREGIHSQLFVVLCGSQLSVMSSLGSESEPLFGRFNAGIILLPPLRYDEVSGFYAGSAGYGIPETLTMYGVFGGTPRYHALVDSSRPMAEEIVNLVLRPGSPLENEVRFLLGSQQVRDPSPYNAVLRAIASGATQYGQIIQRSGTDRGSLPHYLRVLHELNWIRKETSFGEKTERRAIYRLSDPFLSFWFHFVAPLASDLQFSDPVQVYQQRIEPYLSDYMGRYVFEDICIQWLKKHASSRLGLGVRDVQRYWSRDGRTEIDLVAELDKGSYLFGECKWNRERLIGTNVYANLAAKVAGLPEAKWRDRPTYILFALGGFTPDLVTLAADQANRLHLVSGSDLFSDT